MCLISDYTLMRREQVSVYSTEKQTNATSKDSWANKEMLLYRNEARSTDWAEWKAKLGRNSLACLTDFALGALPACPLQRSDADVQTHAVVVQPTAGAKKLVQEIPGAVTQYTVRLFFNWEKERWAEDHREPHLPFQSKVLVYLWTISAHYAHLTRPNPISNDF